MALIGLFRSRAALEAEILYQTSLQRSLIDATMDQFGAVH